jgi:CheY-like chemotaxis protein
LKEKKFDLKSGLEQLVRRIADERGNADLSSVVRLSGEVPSFVRSEPVDWQRCLREIEKLVRACPDRVDLHIAKRSERPGKESLHFTIRSKGLEQQGDIPTIVLQAPGYGSGRSCDVTGRNGGIMRPIFAETGEPARESDAVYGKRFTNAEMHNDMNSKPRVLLAEDNPPNRFVAQTYLEKNGYSVLCAENGDEVLELLEKKDVDIVLMDIQMPIMDGVEATRRIRQGIQGIDQTIPIIALTAYAMRGDRERFLNDGMDEYMSKPVNFSKLFEMIDRLVKERGRSTCQEGKH